MRLGHQQIDMLAGREGKRRFYPSTLASEWNDRQFDVGRMVHIMKYGLLGDDEISLGHGRQIDEGVRVAFAQRKATARHLQPDTVPLLEHVAGSQHRNLILDSAGRDRFGAGARVSITRAYCPDDPAKLKDG